MNVGLLFASYRIIMHQHIIVGMYEIIVPDINIAYFVGYSTLLFGLICIFTAFISRSK